MSLEKVTYPLSFQLRPDLFILYHLMITAAAGSRIRMML